MWNSRSYAYKTETFHKGAKAWTDRNYVFTTAPRELDGGLLFQGPCKAIAQGTEFKLTLRTPSTIYLLFEHGGAGRHGGFEAQLMGTGNWTKQPNFVSTDALPMDVLYQHDSIGTVSLGKTTTSETVLSIVVKPTGKTHRLTHSSSHLI